MNEKKLACCVVRDLLPSYIEDLTEAETTAMVKEHLDDCSDCRKIEQNMRHSILVEKPTKHELKFLARVKRTRLIAVVLSCVMALWCMGWLYDQEFHYSNTDAGRLAAVLDYIPMPEDSSMPYGVKAGTALHVGAWTVKDDRLFIFYFADNAENVHGIIHLVRGFNGKYRILEANISPSDYTGGIYGKSLTPKGTDWQLYCLAGYNCRDIHRAEIEFVGHDYSKGETYSAITSLELTGKNFLSVIDQKTLRQELGLGEKELADLYIKSVELFDKNGEKITDEYVAESSVASWGSGKTTAETSMLYVYMGIIALLGMAFMCYFLRRD